MNFNNAINAVKISLPFSVNNRNIKNLKNIFSISHRNQNKKKGTGQGDKIRGLNIASVISLDSLTVSRIINNY